jgi:hypothetical protein
VNVRASLDRLRFAVEMMGRPATGERLRDPRLGFSVGPTSEQEAYARGHAAGLERARALLLVLAEDANVEAARLLDATANPDADTALGEATGRMAR